MQYQISQQSEEAEIFYKQTVQYQSLWQSKGTKENAQVFQDTSHKTGLCKLRATKKMTQYQLFYLKKYSTNTITVTK